MLKTLVARVMRTKHRAAGGVNQKTMKSVLASLLLIALTAAACGTTSAPTVEQDVPIRGGTTSPAEAPSSAEPDAVPVTKTDAPAATLPSRPMADNEATSTPAPNAPARAVPVPTDRCIGPAATDSKTPRPACPPQ